MKALILNSGLNSRMGDFNLEHLKCMTEISSNESIMSRQLKMIADSGIKEVVITTGSYDGVLVKYCQSLNLPIHFIFVNNPIDDQTNSIYSIYCAKDYLDDDIILMDGNLVFENEIFDRMIASSVSCMAVSSSLSLSDENFKVQVIGGVVKRVGVTIFNESVKAKAVA